MSTVSFERDRVERGPSSGFPSGFDRQELPIEPPAGWPSARDPDIGVVACADALNHILDRRKNRADRPFASGTIGGECYRTDKSNGVPVRVERWNGARRAFETDIDLADLALPLRDAVAVLTNILPCPSAPLRRLLEFAVDGGELSLFVEVNGDGIAVADGFDIPVGYVEVSWRDADHLFVSHASDSDGSVSYARETRLLRRGQRFEGAKIIFSGEADDLAVHVDVQRVPAMREVATRWISTYAFVHAVRSDSRSEFRRLDLPPHVDAVFGRRHVALLLYENAAVADLPETPAGSLVLVTYADETLSDVLSSRILVEPREGLAIEKPLFLRDNLLWTETETNRSRLRRLDWEQNSIDTVLERFGASIDSAPFEVLESCNCETALVTVETFLRPPEVFRLHGNNLTAIDDPDAVPSAHAVSPATFVDTHNHRFVVAPAHDGSEVPYHLVAPHRSSRSVPTLIYVYGGFNVSLSPFYLDDVGELWLEGGCALAIPQVRGGGERGLAWQHRGRGEGRLDALEDFVSVARHLVESGVAPRDRVFGWGESNGGLLLANAALTYPHLLAGVWCAHPVLNLVDYDDHGQGTVWRDEFGNPDDPVTAKVLDRLSPLNKVRSGISYPPFLLTRGRADDRISYSEVSDFANLLRAVGAEAYVWTSEAGGHNAQDSFSGGIPEEAAGFSFLRSLLTDRAHGRPFDAVEWGTSAP